MGGNSHGDVIGEAASEDDEVEEVMEQSDAIRDDVMCFVTEFKKWWGKHEAMPHDTSGWPSSERTLAKKLAALLSQVSEEGQLLLRK